MTTALAIICRVARYPNRDRCLPKRTGVWKVRLSDDGVEVTVARFHCLRCDDFLGELTRLQASIMSDTAT